VSVHINSLLSHLTRHLLVSILLVFILLILRPEILQFFSTRYLGGAIGDPGLYVWLVESFVTDPMRALRYESLAMYPYPETLAWSDNFFLPSSLVYLAQTLGLTTIQGYNLVTCTALVLNGFTSFLVARFLKLPFLFAISAGVSVELCSVLIGNLGHPQLLYFFWVPIALLPWCGEVPKKRWLLLSGIALSGAFYCSVYYSIFGAVGIVALLPFTLNRWKGICSLSAIAPKLLLFLTGVLPIVPSILPYMRVRAAFGGRHLFESSYFAATGASYLSFPSLNLLHGASSNWSHGEALLSPGYIILLILLFTAIRAHSRETLYRQYLVPFSAVSLGISSALASTPSNIPEFLQCAFTWILLASTLTLSWQKSPRLSSLIFLSILFFILSFGPGGNPAKHEPSWSVFTPFFYFFPGVESIRASGRFGIACVVLSIPLAFYSLHHLFKKHSGGALSILIPISFASIVVTENFLRHVPVDAPSSPPPIFSTLRSVAKRGEAAIVLPFSGSRTSQDNHSWGDFAAIHTQYMIWSLTTSTPLVNGYSGQRSRIQEDLIHELNDFPSPRSVAALKRICGLRYIVLLSSEMPSWNRELFFDRLNNLPSPLTLVESDSQGNFLLLIPQSREVTSPSNPFFTPIDRPIAFEITASSAPQSCLGVVERWEKGESGIVKRRLQEITLSSSPTTLHIDLPSVFPALPGVISISGSDCEVEVACSVQ
jgi:hypothetical protein